MLGLYSLDLTQREGELHRGPTLGDFLTMLTTGSMQTVARLHSTRHKVRTYKEYHSVCPSSELGLSQPLSRQLVFPSPQKQGGGGTLACGWGVGGSPNYIHLTAEYKLPILSLKRLKLYTNTIKITILEYKNDLFSA